MYLSVATRCVRVSEDEDEDEGRASSGMSSSDEYDEFPKESEDCDVVSWMYEDEVGEDDARDDDKDDDEVDEDDDAIVPVYTTRDVLLPEPDEEVRRWRWRWKRSSIWSRAPPHQQPGLVGDREYLKKICFGESIDLLLYIQEILVGSPHRTSTGVIYGTVKGRRSGPESIHHPRSTFLRLVKTLQNPSPSLCERTVYKRHLDFKFAIDAAPHRTYHVSREHSIPYSAIPLAKSQTQYCSKNESIPTRAREERTARPRLFLVSDSPCRTVTQ